MSNVFYIQQTIVITQYRGNQAIVIAQCPGNQALMVKVIFPSLLFHKTQHLLMSHYWNILCATRLCLCDHTNLALYFQLVKLGSLWMEIDLYSPVLVQSRRWANRR